MDYITPSLSFKYNGVDSDKLDIKTQVFDGKIVRTLPDGLVITTVYKKYERQGVIWWKNYFENPTENESGIISDLFDGDFSFPMEPDPIPCRKDRQSTLYPVTFRLIETTGGNGGPHDYEPKYICLWENNDAHRTKNEAGRSGYVNLPFLDLNRQNAGCLVAVGWTGAWHAFTKRNHDNVNFKCGLETTNFKMLPGEKFRTASVAAMLYDDGVDNAHNRWRSFMREISPLCGKGRGEDVPFSAIFWGNITSENMINRWKKLIELDLPFDTCWIDAGWYEPLKAKTCAEALAEWPNIGTWEVNKTYHPDGYQDLIKFLNDNGKMFMVWFEPERVHKGIEWQKPLLLPGPERDNNIVALNEDEVCDNIIKRIGDMVEYLNLGVYRQDYNIAPIDWWRLNEADDRKGTVEIHYINNLWRFWDALLERFPHLLIDNCAGGGHRNDIEMLSRAVPMWRSDFQCQWDSMPEGNQIQRQGLARWTPFSGCGYGPTLGDLYSWRSAYDNGMTVRTWEHSDPEWEVDFEAQNLGFAQKYFKEYNEIRHYFSLDYYLLFPISSEVATWQASQYHDPETGSGIVLAFRRKMCPSKSATAMVKGFNPEKKYEFTDRDTLKTFVVSGKELLENGLELYLEKPYSSLLYQYKEI